MTRGEITFAVISGLLVNEATDISPWLAIRLVRWAARLRYPHAPDRAATRSEELAAVINDRPGKLLKLFTAVGFALHALVVLTGTKSVVDRVVASVALVLLLPLLLILALAIRVNSPGPVFFQQERVTKGGRVFRIYRFRTMRTDLVSEDLTIRFLKPDPDPLLTPMGRFLRQTGLDELPQLWNVLKGDMTFLNRG